MSGKNLDQEKNSPPPLEFLKKVTGNRDGEVFPSARHSGDFFLVNKAVRKCYEKHSSN